MPNQYKMVFLDLDGTTITHDQRITTRTKNLLKHLDSHGVPIIITTGRSIYSTRHLFTENQIDLQSPVITLNGTVIYEQLKGKIQSYTHLKDELLMKLRKLLHHRSDIENYIFEGLADYYVLQNDSDLLKSFVEIRKKSPKLSSLVEPFMEPITNLLIRPLENKEQISEWLYEHIEGKLNFVITEWSWIEAVNPEVNKGTAISELAHSQNVKMEEVVAIGDEWNDIEMLRSAGLGVAMENGSEEAKEVADLIAPSNEDEGVAVTLEDIFSDLLIKTNYKINS